MSATSVIRPLAPAIAASSPGARARAARTLRAVQIALGLLWLIDGVLQFQPYFFGRAFVTDVLLPNASGQPGVIAAPITWIADLIEPHVSAFNAFAAAVQVLIGLGLLYRPTVKRALAISCVWALGIWFAGEGLGFIVTGDANPLTGAPGAALLYVLLGLICWPRELPVAGAGRGRWDRPGLIGERGSALAWAGLWLASAVLWLLPANDGAGAVHDAIAAAPSGAAWLTGLINGAAGAAAGAGTPIAVAMSVLSAAIGIAVLCRWHARAFLGVAIALEVVCWFVGQGMGGVLTGQATDVNTAPLMIVIAGVLLAQQPARDHQPLDV